MQSGWSIHEGSPVKSSAMTKTYLVIKTIFAAISWYDSEQHNVKNNLILHKTIKSLLSELEGTQIEPTPYYLLTYQP